MENREGLESCPFCGSDNLSNDGHEVICEHCKASGPAFFPIPDAINAIKAWNKRSDRSQRELYGVKLELFLRKWQNDKLLPSERLSNIMTDFLSQAIKKAHKEGKLYE